MTVFVIGVLTVTALVSLIVVTLGNESDARRRQIVRDKSNASSEERRVDYVESRQAA